jgi:hypothetical protein
MTSIDQQLTDAAIRYLALLDAGTTVSIATYVQNFDPAIRDELAAYLRFVLETGQPVGPPQLTAEEREIVERSRQRSRERIAARLRPAPRSLTAVRSERRLSTGRLAQLINVPPEVLMRIERGAVLIASLPDTLISRLAEALGTADAEMRSMLMTPLATTEARLSAQDGTTISEEAPITFAEAMARSNATPGQRAEWMVDPNG